VAKFGWKKKTKIVVISWIATTLIRLWFGTVRVKILDQAIYDKYFLQTGEKMNMVAGSWHRHAIFLFYFFRNLDNKLIMISQSTDGEITARVAKKFAYRPVRGSSSKGGSKALEEMIALMKSDSRFICGTPMDGPRGPARQLKKGLLVVAKETNAVFVPMACSGTKLITLSKAWDKTILPYPFSEMVVGFGVPQKIPVNQSPEEFERLRHDIELEMNELTDKVDRFCNYSMA